jgi:predicted transposase/invertase (TIGR01784 family)
MVAEKNPMIEEAYCKLQVMSEDEANRMIYEARLKAQRDEYSRMQGALRKGRQEIARNLKALAVPAEKIAQATGLSVDEIAAW